MQRLYGNQYDKLDCRLDIGFCKDCVNARTHKEDTKYIECHRVDRIMLSYPDQTCKGFCKKTSE